MGELSLIKWILAGLSAFLVGFSKSGFTGASIPVPPLMAAIFPARASTGILLPILIMGDILAVAWYRRHAHLKVLFRILPFAAAGVVLGYLVLGAIDDAVWRPLMAVIMLTLITLTILKESGVIPDDRIPRNLAFAAVMGVLAGVTTMIANAAGPVMIVYFIAMDLRKEEFIGTAAWFFFTVNLFKLPFSASLGFVTPETLTLNLKLFVFVALGAVIGIVSVKKISQKAFRTVVLVLAAASSVLLLL